NDSFDNGKAQARSVGKPCLLSTEKWFKGALDFFRRHSRSIIGNAELISSSGTTALNSKLEAHVGAAVLHRIFINISKHLGQEAFGTTYRSGFKTDSKETICFFHCRQELVLKRFDKRLCIRCRVGYFGVHSGKSKQVGDERLHSSHTASKNGIGVLMFRYL